MIYDNGQGHCFSCNAHDFTNDNKKEQEIEQRVETPELEGEVEHKYYAHRGISERTMRFYDIQTKFIDGQPFEVGFPYPSGSVKLRDFNEKKFKTIGTDVQRKTPGLFGLDKFDPGGESITITAGEYDAPSIYEAVRGKTAAVSLRSGNLQQAIKDVTHDWEKINSFKKIIFALDNDGKDHEVAKHLSTMFDFNKVYHVKFDKYKDANDYFQNGEPDALQKVWEAAKRYTPDNIISQFADIEKALDESKEDEIGTYPFRGIQSSTYGLHRGEVIVVKGGSGIGKTEIFRAIEHHLLKTTNSNIGIIHLEEDNGTTVKAIAGYELDINATLPDCGLDKRDILDGYRKAVGDRDDRVHIYSSFETEDEAVLVDNIRYLVTVAKCDFIFLDHITWLATGMQQEDERLKLDRLSQKLKLLAKELRFCLVMISHTNDDGRTRGSRNIENVANTMIHITRDKEHPDENVRNTMYFMIQKVRLGGMTGPAGCAIMDRVTGKLREQIDDDQPRIQVR